MDAKEKLLEATIALIKEKHGDIKLVTTREIVKRAEVSIALINYHFQSKKHLVELCVQKIVNSVIENATADMTGLSDIEQLKKAVKMPSDFLYHNPEIAKISILGDFANGQLQDNTMRTAEDFYSYIAKFSSSEDDFFKILILLHGFQGVFLRRDLYKDKFDLSNKAERDKKIESLIDKLFGESEQK